MLGINTLPQARSVAYASVIMTQLAQTLTAGRTGEGLTRSVLGAVAGSTAILLATFAIPPVRTFLSLVVPTPLGWALVGAAALVAVALNYVLASLRLDYHSQTPLLAAPTLSLAPVQM